MELGRRLADDGGAALVIDYGHAESAVGETLQAVGQHAYADPLTAPGDIDLTAHVDFQALARAVEAMGANGFGPIEQSRIPAPPRHRDRVPPRSRPRRLARRRRRYRLSAGAADRPRPHRHGHAVQGCRLRAPVHWRAAGIRVNSAACCRPLRSPSSRASATPSSRAPAACRRASMPRSMAASARTMRPTRSPKTAPAWPQRSA